MKDISESEIVKNFHYHIKMTHSIGQHDTQAPTIYRELSTIVWYQYATGHGSCSHGVLGQHARVSNRRALDLKKLYGPLLIPSDIP